MAAKDLTQKVIETGNNAGADIVGVCDAALLKELHPEYDAEKFLDDARSVVIAAAADPRRIAKAKDRREYVALAFPGYQRADGAATSMECLLEAEGYATRRVMREWHRDSALGGSKIATLSIKHAAQTAGMGTIGLNRLLITPDYGPRVRMSAIITDADLTPGAPLDGQLCDNCGACVAACPAGAICEDGEFGFMDCSYFLFAGLKTRDLRDIRIREAGDVLRDNAGRLFESLRGWLESAADGRRLYYNCGECLRICNGHIGAGKKAEKPARKRPVKKS